MSDQKRTRTSGETNPRKERKTLVDPSVLNAVAQHNVTERGLSPVLNEHVIEEHVLTDMEQIVQKGDLRKLVGLKPSSIIEIKWSYEFEEDDKADEVKWELATIHEYTTGRTHRVYDVDEKEDKTDETDFEDIPIVSIHYTEESDEYHDICIIGDHLILDVERDCLVPWRYHGDTYDDDDDDSNGNGDTVLMMCESNDDLRRQIDELIPKMFINILEKYRSRVDNMSPESIEVFTQSTLGFKKLLADQIFKFFTDGNTVKDGTVMCLARDDVDTIIQNCLDECNNI
jgi:hypothetical protein